MKRIIAVILSMLILSGCTAAEGTEVRVDGEKLKRTSPIPIEIVKNTQENVEEENISENAKEYSPLNFDIQKSVWVSYIELADMLGSGEKEFSLSFAKELDRIAALGCNTVYFHARAFGDAYYDSKLFAKNELIQSPGGGLLFDPLAIAVRLAHDRGISLHAWINPMRCCSGGQMEKMAGTAIGDMFYEDSEKYFIKASDGRYWLDPANAECRELIAKGAEEIALNYDVDGIHIDDYFYPNAENDDFDSDSFAAYTGGLSLEGWRRENCSQMVRQIYSAVKNTDERILFGVSPQGNVRNNYDILYADVEKWCSEEGYLDYIVPQIYFGYDDPVCPFAETLERWKSMVNGDKKLVCGIGAYKIADGGELENDSGVIARQVSDALENNCGGFALYGYRTLFENDEQRLETEKIAVEAAINALNY